MDNIDGLSEMDGAINDMVRKLTGRDLERLTEVAGAEIFLEVANRAPVLTGKLKASIGAVVSAREDSASFSIQVANSSKNGIQHYAVFIEYGHVITRKQRTRPERRIAKENWRGGHVPAQPFMRPAFDAAAPRAVGKFADALNRILAEKMRGSR